MKHAAFILLLLAFAFQVSFAQQDPGKIVNVNIVPSSAEPGRFQIATTRIFVNGDSLVFFPAQTHDSSGVITNLFSDVWNAKAQLGGAVEILLSESSINQSHTKISAALQTFAGKTYYQISEAAYAAQFAGVYRIRRSGITTFVKLTDKGQLRQCDQQGNEIDGGRTGTYRIHAGNFLEFRNYFAGVTSLNIYYLTRQQLFASQDGTTKIKKIQ